MAEPIKQFASTRLLSKAQNFLVDNDTYYIMCINKGILNLCCNLLSQAGKWQSTYYTSISDAGYEMPTLAEMDVIEDYIDEFLGECVVNCDELIAAINNLGVSLQNAISNSGCGDCSGSSGAGIYEAEAAPFFDNGDDFPSGYADRATYLSSKCALANYILQRWRNDLVSIRQINAGAFSSSTLAVLLTGILLVPIPFAAIIGLAVVILSLVAISIAAFVDALDELITWLDGLDICTLYSASSAQEAKENVSDDLNAQTFTNDSLTKAIGEYFLTFDAINILFEAKPEGINIDGITIDKPCDECADPATWCYPGYAIALGTGDSPPNNGFTVTSQLNAGQQYIQVTSFPPNSTIRIGAITGWTNPGGSDNFRVGYGGGTGGELYSSNTPPEDQEFTHNDYFGLVFSSSTVFDTELVCPAP